jgi:histidyl-tRNA synthetase
MLTGAPRGTKDILPQAAGRWQYLESAIRAVCGCYGYEEIRTPVFEHTELFRRGIGDTTDIVEKEMYTFTDRGGRSLTLRPENTAAVVRAYIENKLYAESPPFKVFYVGPMFRYDRPQAGRFRQFHQFGAESIGLHGPDADAELILLAGAFLRKLGLEDLKLFINSVGCPQCRPVYRDVLAGFLRERRDRLCPDCQSRLERNPLRAFDCKEDACKKAIEGAPLLKDNLCQSCGEHFSALQSLLRAAGVDFAIDTKLVRGLDYYTKTAFEIQYAPLGAQSAVCGGGRYDGLVEECGGPPTPGVGFAIGLERALLAAESQGLFSAAAQKADVFVAHAGTDVFAAAFAFAARLRAEGVKTGVGALGRGLKAQLKMADKFGARLVFIFGEEELKKDMVIYKDMRTGAQEGMALADMGSILEKIGVAL